MNIMTYVGKKMLSAWIFQKMQKSGENRKIFVFGSISHKKMREIDDTESTEPYF